MKVCPECKQPSNILKKSYPAHIEEVIHFYKEPGYRDDDYFIEDPLISDNSRFKDEYFCIKCNHLYSGNNIEVIIRDEMVEKNEK